ncbi:uncharacterized protein LOC133465125 isoform X1 [Phyllopteryx taeniolatus]|uniref:uncharacterized protein LOC133465125 isoform X1 n=1 Tax=Phyllopteryx taeniolatus TaxID=161469 RepID=UPI002AD59270|nr:uncharacterized protein LOC133465125 isoform X1 [Phyllopteryx taeniolatus]
MQLVVVALFVFQVREPAKVTAKKETETAKRNIRNGQEEDSDRPHRGRTQQTRDLHQAQVWPDEEGVRAERAVRLRDRAHRLQQHRQALPVRQHRHGQGAAQVHRVQRAAREPDQRRHRPHVAQERPQRQRESRRGGGRLCRSEPRRGRQVPQTAGRRHRPDAHQAQDLRSARLQLRHGHERLPAAVLPPWHRGRRGRPQPAADPPGRRAEERRVPPAAPRRRRRRPVGFRADKRCCRRGKRHLRQPVPLPRHHVAGGRSRQKSADEREPQARPTTPDAARQPVRRHADHERSDQSLPDGADAVQSRVRVRRDGRLPVLAVVLRRRFLAGRRALLPDVFRVGRSGLRLAAAAAAAPACPRPARPSARSHGGFVSERQRQLPVGPPEPSHQVGAGLAPPGVRGGGGADRRPSGPLARRQRVQLRELVRRRRLPPAAAVRSGRAAQPVRQARAADGGLGHMMERGRGGACHGLLCSVHSSIISLAGFEIYHESLDRDFFFFSCRER